MHFSICTIKTGCRNSARLFFWLRPLVCCNSPCIIYKDGPREVICSIKQRPFCSPRGGRSAGLRKKSPSQFHLTAPRKQLNYSYFCWEKGSSEAHHSLHRMDAIVPVQPNVLCHISCDNLRGNFETGCSKRRRQKQEAYSLN